MGRDCHRDVGQAWVRIRSLGCVDGDQRVWFAGHSVENVFGRTIAKERGCYKGSEAAGSEGPSTYGPLVDHAVLRPAVLLSPPLSDGSGLSRTRTGVWCGSVSTDYFSSRYWRV